MTIDARWSIINLPCRVAAEFRSVVNESITLPQGDIRNNMESTDRSFPSVCLSERLFTRHCESFIFHATVVVVVCWWRKAYWERAAHRLLLQCSSSTCNYDSACSWRCFHVRSYLRDLAGLSPLRYFDRAYSNVKCTKYLHLERSNPFQWNVFSGCKGPECIISTK